MRKIKIDKVYNLKKKYTVIEKILVVTVSIDMHHQ